MYNACASRASVAMANLDVDIPNEYRDFIASNGDMLLFGMEMEKVIIFKKRKGKHMYMSSLIEMVVFKKVRILR